MLGAGFFTFRAGGESPQPSRAGYRRGKSRCGVNRDINAGDAAVSRIKFKARSAAR